MKNNMKPYKETINNNIIRRSFSKDVNENELSWHRDKKDRVVIVLENNDWMIQFDNELPKKLNVNEEIFIPKNTFHRVIKGSGDLMVEVIETDFEDGEYAIFEIIQEGKKKKKKTKRDACYYKVKSRYSVWPSAYACVPENTSKALTRDGWRDVNQLNIGDDIMTYNIEKDELEFKPILNLHRYKNVKTNVVRSGNNGFIFEATDNHKWVVKLPEIKGKRLQKYTRINGKTLIETSDLLANKGNKSLVVSAPYNGGNNVKLDEIFKYGTNWVKYILDITNEQRQAWLFSAIVYDGNQQKVERLTENTNNIDGLNWLYTGPHGKQSFGFKQKDIEHRDAFLLSAFLNSGLVTWKKAKDKDIYSCHYTSNKPLKNTSNFKIVKENISDVWCPETENGTWVMMQETEGRGIITITGNSGALVKCRKVGAANWGNKTDENIEKPIEEKWSDKYKKSIDCNNPKGFSQKAHCQGKKKIKESIDTIKLRQNEINDILKGYIEAALWTEEERLNDDLDNDIELQKINDIIGKLNNKSFLSFTKDDITDNSLIKAYTDIKKFLASAGDSVIEAITDNGLEQLGHDIWLTRNRHGAGFFDHSYDDDVEKQLTSSAQSLGEVDLYINDDYQLSFGNEHLLENESISNKKNISFEHEHLNTHHGQSDYELGVYEDGEVIDYVDYVIFNNELTVSDILVRPNRRREGFGSMLIKKMKQLHPEAEYKPSLKTDLGSKFIHKDVKIEIDREKLSREMIKKAHDSITRRKGKEYAPDVHELQAWIDDYIKTNNIKLDESKKTNFSKEKSQGLHGWFSRKGGEGSQGWVDCNTCRKNKETGRLKCKPCGREEGEERAKYPACRPYPSACKTKGKGKSWGKKSIKENSENRLIDEKLVLSNYKDYAEIVAQSYSDAPDFDESMIPSYNALMESTKKLFKQLQSKLKVEFVDYNPYESRDQMNDEVKKTGVLKILSLYNDHPLFSKEENLMFRAVHDYFTYIISNQNFDLRGELKAYNTHAKLVPPDALPALFTEVAGQACYAIVNGSFPKQKICKLNGFDYKNIGKIDDINIVNKQLQLNEIKNMENFKQKLEEIISNKDEHSNNYMFWQNLKTIYNAVSEMKGMDFENVDNVLSDGHGWALDHIATSKDDIEEVYHFLKNKIDVHGFDKHYIQRQLNETFGDDERPKQTKDKKSKKHNIEKPLNIKRENKPFLPMADIE